MNEKLTKKTIPQTDPDMLDEYDFSKGIRGKHSARYKAATVKNYRVSTENVDTPEKTSD